MSATVTSFLGSDRHLGLSQPPCADDLPKTIAAISVACGRPRRSNRSRHALGAYCRPVVEAPPLGQDCRGRMAKVGLVVPGGSLARPSCLGELMRETPGMSPVHWPAAHNCLRNSPGHSLPAACAQSFLVETDQLVPIRFQSVILARLSA